MTIGITALVLLTAASCGSSTKKTGVPQSTTTTTRSSPVGRDALTFRLVLFSVPYSGDSTSSSSGFVGRVPITSCENGKAITPSEPITDVVLVDRTKTACYALGPVLLTGHDIDRAVAAIDPTTGQWVVNVHFSSDAFVTKVATPYAHRQIAFVFRNVVETAPTVNEGITGNDVPIAGQDFDQATARDLARALS